MAEREIETIALIEQQMFSDPWSERAIIETFARKQSLILTAGEGPVIMGYLIFYYALDEGEIARIAVLKKYQNQGVGSHLIGELEKLCRQKGVDKLFLEVRESNRTAVNFYRKLGFENNGIRRKYYAEPAEDAVLMSREIN